VDAVGVEIEGCDVDGGEGRVGRLKKLRNCLVLLGFAGCTGALLMMDDAQQAFSTIKVT